MTSYIFTSLECVQWLGNTGVNPRTKRKITPTGKVYKTLEQFCKSFGLSQKDLQIPSPPVRSAREEKGDQPDHKEEKGIKLSYEENWLDLSEKDKLADMSRFIKSSNLCSNTPVAILRETSAWISGNENYKLLHPGDRAHGLVFYKNMDLVVGIIRDIHKYAHLLGLNYSTPGVTLSICLRFFPNNSVFGLQNTSWSKREVYSNFFNPMDLHKSELESHYKSIGITPVEIKEGPYTPLAKVHTRMNNTKNIVWYTDLQIGSRTLVYFKHALALDAISNLTYDFIDLFTPLFSAEVCKKDWNRILKRMQFFFANDDVIAPQYKELTTQNRELLLKEYLLIYGNVYKIHLQPKEKYYYWVIYRLLSRLERLKPFICSIKINLIYSRSMSTTDIPSNIPLIILYVYRGNNMHTKALEIIQEIFAGVEKEVGLDITPRYNHKVNNLLYYAQGDADFKTTLASMGVLDHYFDKSQNHAFLLP